MPKKINTSNRLGREPKRKKTKKKRTRSVEQACDIAVHKYELLMTAMESFVRAHKAYTEAEKTVRAWERRTEIDEGKRVRFDQTIGLELINRERAQKLDVIRGVD